MIHGSTSNNGMVAKCKRLRTSHEVGVGAGAAGSNAGLSAMKSRKWRWIALGSPAATGLSGTETENPYKPPRPEAATP